MFLNLGLGRMGCLPGILTAGAALTLAFSSGTFPREVTHSRSTSATQVYADGLVDYAPENLLLYSSTISNGAWTGSNRSISDDTTANPPDTVAGSTADTIVEDTTVSAFHWIAQNVTKPAAAQTYQFTGYCHSSSTRDIAVYLQSGANGCNTRIRPSTGVITGPAATFGSGWSSVSSTIVSVGGGWYRFTLQATSDTTTTVTSQIALYNAAFSYTGNGTSGATVWGLRLQRGTHSRAEDDYLLQTTSAAVYGPRTQYDPVTLACLGYLNEPQRTNLALRSQEFDNGSWTKSSCSVVANNAVAPDGTMTADTLTMTAQYGGPFQVIAVTSGETYTASCWLRLVSGNAALSITQATGTTTVQAITVTSTWERYTFTFVAGSASLAWNPVQDRNASGHPTVVEAWGAQLEQAATASSYIPTAGASATRAADVAYVDVATWLPALSVANATFYADFVAADSGNYPRILSTDQLGSSLIEIASSTQIASWDGTTNPAASGGAVVNNSRKAALSASAGSRTVAYDGATGTGASNAYAAPTRINIGRDEGGSYPFQGTIKISRVYYGAQSAGQIATLTT